MLMCEADHKALWRGVAACLGHDELSALVELGDKSKPIVLNAAFGLFDLFLAPRRGPGELDRTISTSLSSYGLALL